MRDICLTYNKLWLLSVFFVFTATPAVNAASIQGTVLDHHNNPVENAIISLMPVNREHLPPMGHATEADMDQSKKQYVPYDLPVRTGTAVRFPNKDNIKHHVYSFSPSKQFELKLYSGVHPTPVIFDKPGVVALGCNIHDWMLGYIYILDTPYFAKTDNKGELSIQSIPEDSYIVSVWHPRLRGKINEYEKRIVLHGETASEVAFSIELKRERRRRKPPSFEEEVY